MKIKTNRIDDQYVEKLNIQKVLFKQYITTGILLQKNSAYTIMKMTIIYIGIKKNIH